ncbi:MAG: hypothetical protein JNM18_21155 [Planctomycetaceae bacterium]|nr:hypothetical protein [Planctomycetaceae bacterium]
MDGAFLDLTCACCGYKTVHQEFDGCSLCNWEWDDAEVSHPSDMAGANGKPLFESQRIWKEFLDSGGARKPPRSLFRLPRPEDVKDPDWEPFVALPYSFYINGRTKYHELLFALKNNLPADRACKPASDG